jgi:uncharacterized protein (TIGR03084 family)
MTGAELGQNLCVDDLLSDLAAEQASLDEVVAPLDSDLWDLVTPAVPWTVRDQISHLAHFDEMASLAAVSPEAFMASINSIAEKGADALMNGPLEKGRAMETREVLDWWRRARAGLLEAFSSIDPDARLPWYGPPMRARSSVVARMMETWAHGRDVTDALGAVRPPTGRLFHIADLGVRTFRFSFENRGFPAPEDRVKVSLTLAQGDSRHWNEDGHDSISGPVEDFCLVVTQRRHVDDTSLVVRGGTARRWMELAQVFAGPPGPGRPVSGSSPAT